MEHSLKQTNKLIVMHNASHTEMKQISVTVLINSICFEE